MFHTPGKRWRHVIVNARGTWLPGDPRGFRDHRHRVHSSGDYRSPPPPGEHAGLYRYYFDRAAAAVRLPYCCLPAVGEATRQNLSKRLHALAVVAVTPVHTHFLVELPDDVAAIKPIIGWCKYFATRAARSMVAELNGVDLWAAGETYRPVDSAAHFRRAIAYVATRQGADAWVWRSPDFAVEE